MKPKVYCFITQAPFLAKNVSKNALFRFKTHSKTHRNEQNPACFRVFYYFITLFGCPLAAPLSPAASVIFATVPGGRSLPCMATILSSSPLVKGPSYEAQRRCTRFKIDVPVLVVVPHEDKCTLHTGRGADIGEGGMALFACVEARVGGEIFVDFTPAYAGGPVRIRGVVRNRSAYRYGIEFHARTDSEAQAIERFRNLLYGFRLHPRRIDIGPKAS